MDKQLDILIYSIYKEIEICRAKSVAYLWTTRAQELTRRRRQRSVQAALLVTKDNVYFNNFTNIYAIWLQFAA